MRAKLLLPVLLACLAGPAMGQESRSSSAPEPATAGSRPAGAVGPSGLPVPRWVSLKFARVNARAGPGDDHRLLWVYRVKGLPVQVVQETTEWRRVCDPDGGLAWVHRRVTDGRRSAMNLRVERMPLESEPGGVGRTRAFWLRRSLASLDQCRGSWCRLKVGRVTGWAPKAAVWGAEDAAVCGRRG